jgi:hypothetical protein
VVGVGASNPPRVTRVEVTTTCSTFALLCARAVSSGAVTLTIPTAPAVAMKNSRIVRNEEIEIMLMTGIRHLLAFY